MIKVPRETIRSESPTNLFLAQPFSALLILIALLSGCTSTPQGPDESEAGKSIYFVENRSVDMAVRKDFDEALGLLKSGRYEEAIALLNEVAAKTSNNSAPYINLGIAYSRIGDADNAEVSYRKALEINPEHPVAANELAVLYRGIGRFDDARELYERVVSIYPNFMPARRNYGILCDLYFNDVKCALEHYEYYIQSNPDDDKVKLWIATLRQKAER